RRFFTNHDDIDDGEAASPRNRHKRSTIIRRFSFPALTVLYVIYSNVYANYLLDNCAILKSSSQQQHGHDDVANGSRPTGIRGDMILKSLFQPGMMDTSRHDDYDVGNDIIIDSDGNENVTGPSILVVYAGPSTPKSHRFTELYIKNFEFFLNNGIDCNMRQDTVIVVGREYYNAYLPWIRRLNLECRRKNAESSRGTMMVGRRGIGKGDEVRRKDRIILVSRRAVCYDMEAAYLTLNGGVPGLMDMSSYDYFFFINCGVTGPAPTSVNRPSPWTSHFIRYLDERVKMTGLSMNCKLVNGIHMQSMMYAVDRIGLSLIMKSGAIFDCLEKPHEDNVDYIVERYEKVLSRSILDAGYALRPLIGGDDIIVTSSNMRDCVPCEFYNLEDNRVDGVVVNVTTLTPGCNVRMRFKDPWMESRLKAIFNGRVPSLDDVMFFKTSRLLPPDIASQINYTGIIHWKWP
ncbi:hypothetical protein ACHAXA_010024, partial [Cyclostephanos tholiformis]